MKKRCEATTLRSSYTQAHQCLKNSGVKKMDGRHLCAHHRPKTGRA